MLALSFGLPAELSAAPDAAPQIIAVTLTPVTLNGGDLLNVSIAVKNNSTTPMFSQEPAPGFVYDEGDTFYSRNLPDVGRAFRVGIDFDGRGGIDHPYRWGLGAPLAPGETRTITGAIRMKQAQARSYWAGLVQEQVAWLHDGQGKQLIKVNAPGGSTPTPIVAPTREATPTPLKNAPPEIVSVTLSPTSMNTGDLLNVSIVVKNNSNASIASQEPAPGFVYDEGDTFYSRGLPDIRGAYRVGIDFENRAGIDHPYRWGLGAPLAPGESRTITGIIRLKQTQSRAYWAGLVQEQIAWVEDNEGLQIIKVNAPSTPTRAPSITPTNTPTKVPGITPTIAPTSTPSPSETPIPIAYYGTLPVLSPPTDRPAAQHADLNLALRGYAPTNASLNLIDYWGDADPNAPQLSSIFADQRTPKFSAAYRVYDWNWDCNCRGGLLNNWQVTLLGLQATNGETIHTPGRGATMAEGYSALVLYADAERITLKYTPDDNVVYGYTIHVEGIATEPSLVTLYQTFNNLGRYRLPALRAGQIIGRARGGEVKVAIRDTGEFLDPRSRKDWWRQ